MKRILKFGLVMLAVLVLACGSDAAAPGVTDARIGEPTGPNAALYFTASGYGTDDSLVAAQTRVATSVEIHETKLADDGTMSMQSVDTLDLPASGELVLEPGGYHLMLVGVDTLAVGEKVDVLLTWEKAGKQTIQAEVVAPADTSGDGT
jgi:periplasmic copper chaperone A